MEAPSKDFGTGLLDYVRRNPGWDPERREPTRVAWIPASDQREFRAGGMLPLVPLVAAFFAGLSG
jgi:hypothetical protein